MCSTLPVQEEVQNTIVGTFIMLIFIYPENSFFHIHNLWILAVQVIKHVFVDLNFFRY